ncbi:MAG TPA: NAD(P)/FAD-dependent oxidoreductase [Nitrosospira sp.]|nr:NAD(P)/FAD-dependent oxidoreductase [Nitrosospira sp.]
MGVCKENFKKKEVTVIGGGPAGAWCAFMLASSGAQVSLVHWAGYAPGGVELVSGRARRVIEQHCPVFFHGAAPGVEVHETISLWSTPEPVAWSTMFNPWGPGIAVERSLFDHGLRELARTAGVELLVDAKVLAIEREDDNWELSMRMGEDKNLSLRAEFVVLATGRAATPFFDRPAAPESSKLALVTSLPSRNDKPRHALYVESTSSGWWYALPARNGSSFAGFCVERAELKKRRGSLKEFFVEELCRTRLLAPLLPHDSGSVHISGRMADARPFDRAAGEGWLAVGDTAYAPDPLSGMGIELAIESARLGARAVLEAMSPLAGANSRGALAEYEASMRGHAQEHGKTAAFHYDRLERHLGE